MPNTDTSASSATAKAAPSDLSALLGADRPRRWWQRTTVWLGMAALVVVGGGLYTWQSRQSASTAPTYVTEELRRGNLTLTVSANGTLQPTRSVTIGSELSGTVRNVLVDVNDKVKKGQLLVELDTAKLESQVLRSRASLASAQARLAQAVATTKEAIANLGRLEEVARLSGGKVPSASELDAGRATLDRARADETSARATVEDARAALSTDETNLSKASIRSPIDGVVLTRTVEPGNAVAASLQAVTLFTVAEDLTRLRLDVSVDEADVGSVKVGQDASFTVSAYPSRRYPAQVTRVSFGSTKTDNVVTYITWLEVNNSDMSLRPGMTAAATITSTERKDVLLVPNTALRFTPAQAAGADAKPGAGGSKPGASGSGSGGGIMSQLMPRMPRSGSGPRKPGAGGEAGDGAGKTRQVWVLQDGAAKPIDVQVGISDGRHTEVTGDGLTPGMAVITDQRAAGAKP
ncbi:efflux RND transporter periplasmic adaptor subunit [Acidovorax kalamii]|uniref:efflux RND transporter periplasmic adaptor subunit n=1 Tax=Acidovorax kalamii TaxID=2004485 RepID=UPI002091D0B5|nr:efflux RND transporter periplasmic adaptor subunit [Acidovorax kalamii]MCO5355232.1 efflux RND transporter periplasmic adaptor subunit [Acidovorax kalamii]